jgi:hypothetical protein
MKLWAACFICAAVADDAWLLELGAVLELLVLLWLLTPQPPAASTAAHASTPITPLMADESYM